MRSFASVTVQEAEAYRAYMEEAHPWRLRELAEALNDGGHSLTAMDGSDASLVPLWRWALNCVDNDFVWLREDAIEAIPTQGREEVGRQDRIRQYIHE